MWWRLPSGLPYFTRSVNGPRGATLIGASLDASVEDDQSPGTVGSDDPGGDLTADPEELGEGQLGGHDDEGT